MKVSSRVSASDDELVQLISEYEYRCDRKKSELLRQWIAEKVGVYMRNPSFKRWLRMRYPSVYETEFLGK